MDLTLAGDQPVVLLITNGLGQLVHQKQLADPDNGHFLYTVPDGELAQGIYHLQVFTDREVLTARVIME